MDASIASPNSRVFGHLKQTPALDPRFFVITVVERHHPLLNRTIEMMFTFREDRTNTQAFVFFCTRYRLCLSHYEKGANQNLHLD